MMTSARDTRRPAAGLLWLSRCAIMLPLLVAQLACRPGVPPGASVSTATTQEQMILLPGGEVRLGKDGFADFSPEHTARLDPFFIDRYEVTNAQYAEFCAATEHRLPEFWGLEVYRAGPDFPDHPVVGVSWLDARTYAAWRGCRLPSEAEWEYAARGGLLGQNYSHGDEFDSTLYAPSGFTGTAAPAPVGSFPPNGFDLYDMTRNVSEWVHDWYDPDYYSNSPAGNPTGPWHGTFRVIRGGGWHTGPYCSRVYYRAGLKSNWVDFNVGFRCARPQGESAALRMEEIILAEDIERGVAEYGRMRAQPPGVYYFDQFELNEMGYRLVGADRRAAATRVFELIVEAYPDSYNAHDSLGEVYALNGDRERAIEHYQRAIELYPKCRSSHAALQELEGASESGGE